MKSWYRRQRRYSLGHKRIGFISLGPDMWTGLTWLLQLCLFPRRCAVGEIAYHFAINFAFDPVPPIVYQRIAPAADIPLSSASWTGREVAIAEVRWSEWRRPYLDTFMSWRREDREGLT